MAAVSIGFFPLAQFGDLFEGFIETNASKRLGAELLPAIDRREQVTLFNGAGFEPLLSMQQRAQGVINWTSDKAVPLAMTPMNQKLKKNVIL